MSFLPSALVYSASARPASRCGKTPGDRLDTFTRFAYFVSIACTTEIMPRTGTLPATQCTARPRGGARTDIASLSSR